MRGLTRRRSSRRGVSGLIASIFLFAMLFTTGATYILFVTESQFQLQDAAKAALERDIQRTGEGVQIATSKLGDGDLGVSITNTGSEAIQVKQILVLDANNNLLTNIQSSPLPITLNVQTETASPIDTNITIQQGADYAVRAVTERGSLFSAVYPTPLVNVTSVISSKIASSIGSVSMDTTTLQYSQNDGETWEQGWNVQGGVNTIWRVNVSNLSTHDIYLSNHSSFLCLKIVSGGGGQLSPRVFYISSSAYSTTYPALETQNFTQNGGLMLPANGTTVKTIYLKLNAVGSGGGQALEASQQYLTTLELFGKYDDPTSSSYYGQSLPFVGILTD